MGFTHRLKADGPAAARVQHTPDVTQPVVSAPVVPDDPPRTVATIRTVTSGKLNASAALLDGAKVFPGPDSPLAATDQAPGQVSGIARGLALRTESASALLAG